MIYYVILFLLLLLSALSYFIKDRVDKFLLFSLVIIFLIFFAGLRYQTGYDYDNYEKIYEEIKFTGYSFDVEPSVNLIMNFFNKLSVSYVLFLFLFAFVAVGLKGRFIWQYSLFPFISVVLYFSRLYITADFGQIRQGLAAGLILWSFAYIKENNLKKYTLILLAAISIHISSILFYPIYFIVRKKYKPMVLVIVLCVALMLATIDLKNIVINYLTNFMPEYIAQKLVFYGNSEADEVIGLTYSVFLRLALIIALLGFYRKRIYNDEKGLILFNIYYWGVIFYLLFNSLPQIGVRGSLYFQQFEVLLFPYLFSYSKSSLQKAVIFLFVGVYCYWGAMTVINSQEESFIPYRNVITK